MQQNTRFPTLLAMAFGLGAPLIPGFFSLGIWTSIIYFIGAGVMGLFWPYKSWKWGLWMTVPILVLALLSVVFVGGYDAFIKNDLPRLMIIVVAACAGAIVFPLVKNLLTKKAK